MIEKEIIIPYKPRPEQLICHKAIEKSRFSVIVAHRGFGKALDIETPIPLANGSWKRMLEIVEGDEIFDENGDITKVVYAHNVLYGRNCSRVKFSDETSIVCDEEHLWTTQTKLDRTHRITRIKTGSRLEKLGVMDPKPPTPKTTLDISKTLSYCGEVNHSIAVCQPLKYQKRELALPPYILGLWLGDGTSRNGQFTTMDNEILQSFSAYMESIGGTTIKLKSQNAGRASVYSNKNGFTEKLKLLSVIKNKHIPEQYLHSSIEDRKQLLQGLMDTDGSIFLNGAACEITLKDSILVHSIAELLGGLGIKYSKHPRIIKGRTYIRYIFRPAFNPFKLKAKANRFKPCTTRTSQTRYIVDIQPVESRPVKCITVSSSSRLYLCGKNFIPTHNSVLAINHCIKKAITGVKNGVYGYIAPFRKQAKLIAWDYLQRYTEPIPGIKKNESDLFVQFPNGAKIGIYGADDPDALRGIHWDGVVPDEVAQMKPDIWGEILRPGLASKQGFAVFIGCVSGNTLIMPKNGAIRIGELDKGKGDKTLDKCNLNLYGINKSFHKADGFYYNGEVDTIKIKTRYGFSMEASYPHPILNADGKWQKMSDLSIGDKVSIDYGMDVWGEKDPCKGFAEHYEKSIKSKQGYCRRKHEHTIPLKMDNDFAYLLGLWLAEGSVDGDIYRLTITCGDNDIAEHIEKYGFHKCRSDQWRCNSKELYELFKYIGMPLTTAQNKRLPMWLWKGKREWAEHFISGYLDGDGHVRQSIGRIRREIGFTSSSMQLIQDVQLLLTNMGAIGQISRMDTAPTKKVNKYCVAYQLHIRSLFFETLQKCIKPRIKRKALAFKSALLTRKSSARLGQYFIDEIVSIEHDSCRTLDFTIPDTHSFWTNGFISHNTPKGQNLFHELYQQGLHSPDWYVGFYPVTETKIFSDEELALARKSMSDSQYAQEFLCDFTAACEDALIRLDVVEAACKRNFGNHAFYQQAKVIGVDIARFGDDISCITRRQGCVTWDQIKLRGMHNETNALAGRIAHEINDFKADACFIDAGYNPGVIDLLRGWGYRVTEVNFGGTSTDDYYLNKRVEMWARMRDWLSTGQIPNDPELKGELIAPTYDFKGSNGKMRIESKDDMKKRGLSSPNCFIAGTKITTPRGKINIELLQEGDFVCTPFGDNQIIKIHKTLANKLTTASFSNNETLTGLGSHKVFSFNGGFIRLDMLSLVNAIETDNIYRRLLWKIHELSFIRDIRLGFKERVNIFSQMHTIYRKDFYTGLSIVSIMEKFLRGMMSIIKMAIDMITESKILRLLNNRSIGLTICWHNLVTQSIGNQINQFWIEPELKQVNGIDQLKVENGTKRVAKNHGLSESQKKQFAQSVARNIPPILCQEVDSVQKNANKKKVISGIKRLREYVLSVAKNLLSISTAFKNVVPVGVQTYDVAETLTYNLTLSKDNVYYANGILVENCADSLALCFAFAVQANNFIGTTTTHSFKRDDVAEEWRPFAYA